MANSRFHAMKNRSDELNRKMEEVRWGIATMKGVVRKACEQYDSITRRVSQEIGVEPRRNTTYFVDISVMTPSIAPQVKIYKVQPDMRTVDLNPDLNDWWYAEIDLIHENLDTIIGACEKFCVEKLGLAGEVAFRVQMDRFEWK